MAPGSGRTEPYPVFINTPTNPVLAYSCTETVFRIATWQIDPHVAQIVAVTGPGPTTDEVVDLVDELRQRGIRTLMTSALTAGDQEAFRLAGFIPYEHLLLLHRSLTVRDQSLFKRRNLLSPSGLRTQPVKVADRDAVLTLDQQAFSHTSPLWQVDHDTLVEATRVTDEHRWRIVRRSRMNAGPAGHALTGRTGTTGFLQRIAVHPAAQKRGVGTALLADALRWLVRSGARHAFVNTQPDNLQARALYKRFGFTIRPDGLKVLRLNIERNS